MKTEEKKPGANPFDIHRTNNIQSADVSQLALNGEYITILKNSYVCDKSTIGSYNYIGYNTGISKTNIGRYNSIANNVNIGHGEHPLDKISTSSFIINTSYDELTKNDCTIAHDVWIGSGATIRRGVTLGIGCVVGANSFVNKTVPPFAIVGGVPAKLIRYRFGENKIARILASKWWELDPAAARAITDRLEKEDD